jgi:hypothetical protein
MTDKMKTLSQKRAEAGRKGGRAKVVKGPRKLSPERRKEIAKKAAKARWAKEFEKKECGGMDYEDIN